MTATQRVDVARLSELLTVIASSNPDRRADYPGGCDCHECGCIFIGGDGHDYCAQCEAKRQLLAMLPEALPDLLQQLAERDAEVARLSQNVTVRYMTVPVVKLPNQEIVTAEQVMALRNRNLEGWRLATQRGIELKAAERAREGACEELATLQVIHNCLRRDHERSKAQAKAAREIAEQWNADARAEGFGGGSVKGREIIEAMEAAFLAANGGATP